MIISIIGATAGTRSLIAYYDNTHLQKIKHNHADVQVKILAEGSYPADYIKPDFSLIKSNTGKNAKYYIKVNNESDLQEWYKKFIKDAHVIMLAVDLSTDNSISFAEEKVNLLRQITTKPIICVGTKADLLSAKELGVLTKKNKQAHN